MGTVQNALGALRPLPGILLAGLRAPIGLRRDCAVEEPGYVQRVADMISDDALLFLARPYIAGYSLDSAIDQIKRNASRGLSSGVDVLAEELCMSSDMKGEKREIELMTKAGRIEGNYYRLLESINLNDPFVRTDRRASTVSLKPSSFYIPNIKDFPPTNLHADDPERSSYPWIRDIAARAKEYNISLTLDMEDSRWTGFTVSSYLELVEDDSFDNVGIALQSRLDRTKNDIDRITCDLGDRARVRLCIGVYPEVGEDIIPPKCKDEMKLRMIEYAITLLKEGAYVEFATHDEATIERFLSTARGEEYFSPERLEFQNLLGVPRKSLHDRLTDQGFIVRLYSPYAVSVEDSATYCRRSLENMDVHLGLGAVSLMTRAMVLRYHDLKAREYNSASRQE